MSHDDDAGERPGTLTVIDGSTDVAVKHPRALGRQRLETVKDVRQEMCRAYRAVTSGKISNKAGNSLVYMLSVVVRTMEIERDEQDLELLKQLRERMKGKP